MHAADDAWWRRTVVYQIYPRSFADTDGNGIGDLPGIIDHLDHLGGLDQSLGIGAIWLSPIYPSPGFDAGYDVADHASIDPLFGSLADFDRLVGEAHSRGIAVILDLVLNHTSDQHPWFRSSRSGRAGPHGDWYIWRDPAGTDGRGRPIRPNNWVSFFGGPAWQWDDTRGQFYLHTFLPEQPDLNWREPAVRAAQWAMVRGWLRRGVDAFRLDVFNALLKSPDLASNPRARWFARRAWDRQRHVHDKDQPDLPGLLDEFRAILDEQPGRMSVGELFAGRLSDAAGFYRPRHLVFDFGLIAQPWSARAFAREIALRERIFGPERWPTVVLSNHDNSRHVSRYLRSIGRSDAATADRLARAAALILLTLRGTPFLYYGEEIGLPDVAVPKDEIADPPARRASFWFPWWNRDQCRSPMPWSGGPLGGFTTGRPWIRMIDDPDRRNVGAQELDRTSVLAAYRNLLALRGSSPALSEGSLSDVRVEDGHILTYVRESGSQRALIAVNFDLAEHRLDPRPGSWSVDFATDPGTAVRFGDRPPERLAGLEGVLLVDRSSP